MMKLIWEYIKSCVRYIILAVFICCIFVLISWLGDMNKALMLYGAALCAATCAVAFGAGLRRFVRRHKKLALAKEQILISLENLPLPEDLIEADYQALLEVQHEGRLSAQTANDLHYGEALDYFTLWAHQIKTPIAAMRLILQSEPDKYGAELEQELFKIEQYVEMVLSYLRLDSDYTDFVLRCCDIDDIIKQSVRKFAKQFIRKRISLRYEGTELRVVTDEKWLGFVLEQLLANALKYTVSGSISISAGDDRIVIEDTGIGIAAEDLPRVFEKGYTGYNGRTDKKSTGIGLYLCRRILTKLGHEISIESAVGRGTKVTIALGGDEENTLPRD